MKAMYNAAIVRAAVGLQKGVYARAHLLFCGHWNFMGEKLTIAQVHLAEVLNMGIEFYTITRYNRGINL